jgi:hypothetical protein
MEHTNTLCGQNARFLTLKIGVILVSFMTLSVTQIIHASNDWMTVN